MRADVISLALEPNAEEGIYSFVCPVCEDVVEKPADRKIVSLLRSVGVEVSEPDLLDEEEEMFDLEERPDGPPITIDDVIDFHFLMSQEDWFEQLTASTS